MRVVISRHTHLLPLTPNAPVQARWANAQRAGPPPPNTPTVACNRLLGCAPNPGELLGLRPDAKPANNKIQGRKKPVFARMYSPPASPIWPNCSHFSQHIAATRSDPIMAT